jgi:hypothetical protein
VTVLGENVDAFDYLHGYGLSGNVLLKMFFSPVYYSVSMREQDCTADRW